MVENRFSYENGRLLEIEQLDEKGELLRIRNLRYRADGSLRSLKSDSEERIDWRAASFSESFLDSLYIADTTRSSEFSYEEGRIRTLTEDSDGAPTRQTEYLYGNDGSLEKEIHHDFSDGSRRVLYYDRDGNIIVENLYKDEVLERTTLNVYEEGRLKTTEEQSSDSRMRWEYEYAEEGADPVITRQYINGLLVKESEKLEEGVRETLYRGGEPVLVRTKEDEP
jgi:antitoxin component YwqK of YwqJK toxin-antitoxin module